MSSPEAPFPSLRITADRLEPQGSFAEAQAEFLDPDPHTTATLARLLADRQTGVVAHFYMDAELQGVLSACAFPHIHISDSLAMADAAIGMAAAGMRRVVVLGVDFMSENVRAMLDAAGHQRVAVYRVADRPIGCSLAESADAPAYRAYLTKAAASRHPLHVIYINTSLQTKARAHALLPTITCTSSNIVRLVLQAFAQIPELELWFGPDSYMGANLKELFARLGELGESAIRALHPAHDRRSVASIGSRLHYFEQGVCVVHHLFGDEVAAKVARDYPDALLTAHLEVPGRMFCLALAAQERSRGVVGSTSNILGFIGAQVEARAGAGGNGGAQQPLRFILGTEAGMVTSIVRRVQSLLGAAGGSTAVEIIFPVASEAVASSDDRELVVVPGVAGGEGCTAAGGCATCPYMKMSSLDGLMDLLQQLDGASEADLTRFEPRQYTGTIAGRTAADLGSEPILHMRHLSQHGELPAALVEAVLAR